MCEKPGCSINLFTTLRVCEMAEAEELYDSAQETEASSLYSIQSSVGSPENVEVFVTVALFS